jgi:hypothetical protein
MFWGLLFGMLFFILVCPRRVNGSFRRPCTARPQKARLQRRSDAEHLRLGGAELLVGEHALVV